MTDHIKRSTELDPWLKARGIVVEPDELSLVVAEEYPSPGIWVPVVECLARISKGRFVCPYYGPGGSDNLSKALRGLEEKTSGVFSLMSWTEGEAIEAHWTDCMLPNVRGYGKTDGLALADLLWKIKEASE